MKQFGLIGYPLSHSFSEKYFRDKFHNEKITDAAYSIFPLEKIEDFVTLSQRTVLSGLNVTIPYKEKIIPFLDELNKEAEEIGAVNTIKFSNGKKTGYNTDIFGFEQSLRPLLQLYHQHVLILGTGGASKAVAYVLKKLGIEYKFVSSSRQNENSIPYDSLNESILHHSTLIVNTSPVGMYPDISNAPKIPYEFITSRHLLYDLVYNPEETEFLKRGKAKGAETKNGLEMLFLQAEKSWEIWNKE